MKTLTPIFIPAALATAMVHADPAPTPIGIELRTFIAHCDPNSRGISCVVTNNSNERITVHRGYDGERNQLVGETHNFPVRLRSNPPTATKEVVLAPGESETVFTLSLDAILLFGPNDGETTWHWGWAYQRPRGAPPMSPVHPERMLGWQACIANETSFSADIEISGRKLKSEPLQFRVPPPHREGETGQRFAIKLSDGTIAFRDEDILCYHWWSHAIRIREEAMLNLRTSIQDRLVKGVPFQVWVGDDQIYEGVFTTWASSVSQSMPVIRLNTDRATDIQCGYPAPEFFRGVDPRPDDRIRRALRSVGVLRE